MKLTVTVTDTRAKPAQNFSYTSTAVEYEEYERVVIHEVTGSASLAADILRSVANELAGNGAKAHRGGGVLLSDMTAS